jgi:hypothetical protein
MPSMRRRVWVTAAATICTLGLLPSAPAAADTYRLPPADCTSSTNGSMATLTCTNRPANQQWYVNATCHSGWVDSDADGNHVIGNGSSVATCPFSSHPLRPFYFVTVP